MYLYLSVFMVNQVDNQGSYHYQTKKFVIIRQHVFKMLFCLKLNKNSFTKANFIFKFFQILYRLFHVLNAFRRFSFSCSSLLHYIVFFQENLDRFYYHLFVKENFPPKSKYKVNLFCQLFKKKTFSSFFLSVFCLHTHILFKLIFYAQNIQKHRKHYLRLSLICVQVNFLLRIIFVKVDDHKLQSFTVRNSTLNLIHLVLFCVLGWCVYYYFFF